MLVSLTSSLSAQFIKKQEILSATAQVIKIYQPWHSDLLHWTIDFRAYNWALRTFHMILQKIFKENMEEKWHLGTWHPLFTRVDSEW